MVVKEYLFIQRGIFFYKNFNDIVRTTHVKDLYFTHATKDSLSFYIIQIQQ